MRDRRNFVQCVRELLKDVEFEGRGQVLQAAVSGRSTSSSSVPSMSRKIAKSGENAGNPVSAEPALPDGRS